MLCENCNKEIKEDNKFCSYCGKEVKETSEIEEMCINCSFECYSVGLLKGLLLNGRTKKEKEALKEFQKNEKKARKISTLFDKIMNKVENRFSDKKKLIFSLFPKYP